ncbi:hypothetical protein PoB_000344000 [Plakobranchus ocellatus]|uniref:Uncharacterized protein n=1 Tax=Plakobranchus ocellatus TaxID=259542 RepID=A0AAV3Y230_9GAST|nr:hypothetical protein PoB_000344000 [Plakobranchus ocellatus]
MRETINHCTLCHHKKRKVLVEDAVKQHIQLSDAGSQELLLTSTDLTLTSLTPTSTDLTLTSLTPTSTDASHTYTIFPPPSDCVKGDQ